MLRLNRLFTLSNAESDLHSFAKKLIQMFTSVNKCNISRSLQIFPPTDWHCGRIVQSESGPHVGNIRIEMHSKRGTVGEHQGRRTCRAIKLVLL